jgi:uncharacterized protein (TIGR02145 family)
MTRCIYLLLAVPVFLACSDETESLSPVLVSHGSFTDPRDHKIYQSVSIETQTWMAENLAYIPYVSDGVTQSGIWVYDYEGTQVDSAIATVNYQIYGCLYDWETASEVCPSGWHLPSDEEWHVLAQFIRENGYEYADGDALKSPSLWISGTKLDAFGFHALPAGSRGIDGSFYYNGGMTSFWSSTELDENAAWVRRIDHTRHEIVHRTSDKRIGFSVRCIEDKPIENGFTDDFPFFP